VLVVCHRSWARRATRAFPEHEVTTRHTYEIKYRYRYSCTQCLRSFGRHSKSVDLDKQVRPCAVTAVRVTA